MILANTIFFFYFSKIVDVGLSNGIKNTSYYVYVLYGLIISDLTIQIINRYPNELRDYQLTGVLESFLSSKFSFFIIILPTSIFPFFISIIKIVLYLVFAKAIFGIEIILFINLMNFILILFIFLLFLMGLGLIGCAYTMLFKKAIL